jgi:HNH endonuclease
MGNGHFAGKNHWNWKGGRLKTFQCKQCKKKFEADMFNAPVFCSLQCKGKFFSGKQHPNWNNGTKIFTCKMCGKKFEGKRCRDRKFCSTACGARFYFTGNKNPNWKDGESAERDKIKQTQEYKDWRATVYKRDEWTCVQCGYRGKKIVAHHIKRFADYPELRFDIDNGVTLCRSCHALIENPQRLICQTLEKVKIESDLHGDMERRDGDVLPTIH